MQNTSLLVIICCYKNCLVILVIYLFLIFGYLFKNQIMLLSTLFEILIFLIFLWLLDCILPDIANCTVFKMEYFVISFNWVSQHMRWKKYDLHYWCCCCFLCHFISFKKCSHEVIFIDWLREHICHILFLERKSISL